MKECNIPDPQRFRAQATGIGQTREASERTGMNRSAEVSEHMPDAQRKHAVGYPPKMEDCCTVASMPIRRGTLRRY